MTDKELRQRIGYAISRVVTGLTQMDAERRHLEILHDALTERIDAEPTLPVSNQPPVAAFTEEAK